MSTRPPGPVRLYPYQREIADAISDPEIGEARARRVYDALDWRDRKLRRQRTVSRARALTDGIGLSRLRRV